MSRDITPADVDPVMFAPQRTPRVDRVIFAIAVLFSAFQVYTSAFAPLSSIVIRALHVSFLMLLTFAMFPSFIRGGRRDAWLGWVLGAIGVAIGLYQWVFEADLIQRSGDLTTADVVVGVALIVLVFEAARRIMGIALPLICAAFLGYALFGQYLPGSLAHRGFGIDQVINQMSFGTEGIYGIPIYVSSTYIFLFILFGTFLEQAGMIKLFTDFSLGTVGHTRGGPAKVAVVASGLMGTINGSGVANVVTTGQFTIPLMKRFGYRAEFRGWRRSDVEHGRADHAAGHGCRGVHHGRDDRRALRGHREGRDDTGAPVLRYGVLDGPPGSGTSAPAWAYRSRNARMHGRRCRGTGI